MLEQELQIARQFNRFRAQCFHSARLVEHRERGAQWCDGKNRWVANLPAISRRNWNEVRLEVQAESRVRIVPEPARQSWQACIARMTLMDECGSDRTRTGVQVFVGAPHRKIDVPIVQRERDIADHVRKIESCNDAVFPCRGCDFLDVEQLTREKIHAAKHHHRELFGVFIDQIDNLFRSNGKLAFARARKNERRFRIELMMHDLGLDGVGVGRKCRLFH